MSGVEVVGVVFAICFVIILSFHEYILLVGWAKADEDLEWEKYQKMEPII